MKHIHESFIDLYWTLADVILLKTFTLFTIPEFAVGLFCHWCRIPYFAGVVCCSLPVCGSPVTVSRPGCLLKFTTNRASRLLLGTAAKSW